MRHSTTAALAAAAVALAGALPCQTVTTRVLAATPLTATCVAGPSTDQASQPAVTWIGDWTRVVRLGKGFAPGSPSEAAVCAS